MKHTTILALMNLHPSLTSSCLATMPAYIKERFTIIKTELSLIETKEMYKEKFRLTEKKKDRCS